MMIWIIVILIVIIAALFIGCNQADTDKDELDEFANGCGFVNYEEYLNHRDSADREK